jgi:streptomycin 6-kinase
MVSSVMELPESPRRSAESRGEAGRAWLAALPGYAEQLRELWRLELGEVLAGGKSALVVRVKTGDGRDAVLKIGPPGDGFADEVRTIAAAEGRGYVRLYAYDPERNAALLEALGPMMTTDIVSPAESVEALGHTLTQVWKVPPLPGLAGHKAEGIAELIRQLWTELSEPCSRELTQRALSYADHRAQSAAAKVMCHGDPHPANAMRVLVPRLGAESGYVFADPEPLLAEPAYDLGVVIRGWPEELSTEADPAGVLRGYCRRLEEITGVPAQAIWEWGFIERVSSGLYLMRYGHEQEGRAYLDSAERLLSRPASGAGWR